jgi:protein-disulfide isomerase
MNFMAEDEKTVDKKESVVLIKKSTLIMIIVGVIAVSALVVGWRFLFPVNADNNIQYIANDTPILGNASVYVIEFSDYLCPYCEASEGVNQGAINSLKQGDPSWEAPIPGIIRDYVNTGKASLIFRNFPVHNNNQPALAAKCAQEQDKFWEYHRTLFDNYFALSDMDLKKYASDMDLNLNQFNQCLESKKYQVSLDNDISDAKGVGVDRTPIFFIGNEDLGYEKLVGAQSYSVFKQIIDSKISV